VADWTRAERTRTTVEYEIPANEPWGACWNQVQQALDLAYREYKEIHGKEPYDDSIRVHVTGDAVTITFEKSNTLN
jgi:hypothetical protein